LAFIFRPINEFMNFRFFLFFGVKISIFGHKNRKQTAAFCDQCADSIGGWLQWQVLCGDNRLHLHCRYGDLSVGLILTLWTQNLITTCVSLESIVHLTSMRTGTVASFHSLNRLPRSICQPQLQALPVSNFLVQLDRFTRIDAVILSERTQRNFCFLLIIFAFLTSLTDCIWNLDNELYAEHLCLFLWSCELNCVGLVISLQDLRALAA